MATPQKIQEEPARPAGPELSRFWSALEGHAFAAKPLLHFQSEWGEQSAAFLSSLLKRQVNQSGQPIPAATYPCTRCGHEHTVDPSNPANIIAYLDDERLVCADITGLSATDVAAHRVDVHALIDAIRTALNISGTPDASRGRFIRLGSSAHGRHLVYLAIRTSAEQYCADVHELLRNPKDPFLFLTATTQDSVAERVRDTPARTVSLADILFADPAAILASRVSADEFMARGLPTPFRLPRKGSPLALRGKKYEISEAFDKVSALRGRQVLHVHGRLTPFALRVLIESGAGSRKLALTNAEWCEAAYRLACKPLPKEPQSIAFFRTGNAPLYGLIIGKTGKGMYWLDH